MSKLIMLMLMITLLLHMHILMMNWKDMAMRATKQNMTEVRKYQAPYTVKGRPLCPWPQCKQ